MTHDDAVTNDNHLDDHVDHEIDASLDLDNPVSFFLFADAGSGKTRSLVTALNSLREKSGERLRLYGKRVGVITYTNAASDEIKGRLEYDPLIEVSTIHSFVWSLIGGYNLDIKEWLRTNLRSEIVELEAQQSKGKASSKAAADRNASIKAKQKRLSELDGIRRFTYNPSGDNRGRDSLNHAEVIKIGAEFLSNKPLMQRILISKFPALLIDESQDTNKSLMEAFLKLQSENKGEFCLGLFGDTMQRIYSDGKEDLGRELPADWAKPVKRLNHRCPRRIVRLINRLRASVDGHVQLARSDSEQGFIRLFILASDTADKSGAERIVADKMAQVTGDPCWTGSEATVKTLTLEHHMAARRMGFFDLFRTLDQIESFRTGLRDGSLPGLRLFSRQVLPLRKANERGDEFATAAIVRTESPLLSDAALKLLGTNQRANIKAAREAVKELMDLWSNNGKPRFIDVLNCVSRTGLFEVPESLRPLSGGLDLEGDEPTENIKSSAADDVLDSDNANAWRAFLQIPFSEIQPYDEYVSGRAAFDTHQGVKGREFPRVMVVMDDTEARGFMFSYDKLFGAKDKSSTDLENERDGKDTSINRTRRLFYVTCSRARKSLALVAYSSEPQKVSNYVVREGWFEVSEVQVGV